MDEIEVVIRIPEEWIEQFKAFKHPSTLETIILQGTVLPRGHGRLIDMKDICPHCGPYGCEHSDICDTYNAPTIVEADNAEREDKA